MIEQEMTGVWQGKIRVRTQRGQAGELLRRLTELIQHENDRLGVRPTIVSQLPVMRESKPVAEIASAETDREDAERQTLLKYGDEGHGPEPRYLVSYAWGDDTAEGRDREAIVDQLCEAATARGIVILRDKQVLGIGDLISQFMRGFVDGHRVFVVLSDKYLRSPYCMAELLEIWRKSLEDEERFLARVRVFVLPGTKISTICDRIQYARHWKQEYEAIRDEIGPDPRLISVRDFEQFQKMGKFVDNVPAILALVADRIKPRNFDDLVKHGLDDLMPVPENVVRG